MPDPTPPVAQGEEATDVAADRSCRRPYAHEPHDYLSPGMPGIYRCHGLEPARVAALSERLAAETARADAAVAEREQLEREVAELRALFDLQWERTMEAAAQWRAEDPDARALITPDLGVLLSWLMDAETPGRRGERAQHRQEVRGINVRPGVSVDGSATPPPAAPSTPTLPEQLDAVHKAWVAAGRPPMGEQSEVALLGRQQDALLALAGEAEAAGRDTLPLADVYQVLTTDPAEDPQPRTWVLPAEPGPEVVLGTGDGLIAVPRGDGRWDVAVPGAPWVRKGMTWGDLLARGPITAIPSDLHRLELGPTTRTRLLWGGYLSVAQVRAASDDELLAVRNMGRWSVAAAREALDRLDAAAEDRDNSGEAT